MADRRLAPLEALVRIDQDALHAAARAEDVVRDPVHREIVRWVVAELTARVDEGMVLLRRDGAEPTYARGVAGAWRETVTAARSRLGGPAALAAVADNARRALAAYAAADAGALSAEDRAFVDAGRALHEAHLAALRQATTPPPPSADAHR